MIQKTWHGRAVLIYKGTISDLRQEIPRFGMYPFSIEASAPNEYLDLIARKPHREDPAHIPVAAVSKEYGFVEHHDVLETVLEALENFVENPESLEAELRISKYGARMWINFLLPNYKFNPGDGYPIVLQVNCLNSVDKSIAIRLHLSWHREKSDTEMQGRELRKIHNKSFKTAEIEEFLENQFLRFSEEESLYNKWYETKLDWSSVVKWLNKTVSKIWGARAAVRAYHVGKTGNDIEIEKVFRVSDDRDGVKIKEVKLGREPLELEEFDFITNYILKNGFVAADKVRVGYPNSIKKFINDHVMLNVDQTWWHDHVADGKRSDFVDFATSQIEGNGSARFLKVKMIGEVPGLFTPVENVYHVSQVLTWLASGQETIQGQLKRMGQIQGLMDALLKQEKLPITLRLGREYKKSK